MVVLEGELLFANSSGTGIAFMRLKLFCKQANNLRQGKPSWVGYNYGWTEQSQCFPTVLFKCTQIKKEK